MRQPRIFVAVPAMDELHDLPNLLHDLTAQICNHSWEVYVCVNQPDDYWNLIEKQQICERNQRLLDYLKKIEDLPLHVLDYASQGCGWKGKRGGVGMARKVLFDHLLSISDPSDLIVSLDADTRLRTNYLQSVAENMFKHPHLPAISVPYYHPLTGVEIQDRAILRYEIYMRNYAINLYKIKSPYAFTALGSAIVMRAGSLRKIGGITPLKSGEDFYLLQKFRKMAPIGNWNEEPVFPSARLSNRVDFGTGPALIKGTRGQWDSYPIYHHHLFKSIKETYQLLPKLYKEDVDTDFTYFLKKQFNDEYIWLKIRQNVKDQAHFEHAFHEKADGLRIMQYLRKQHHTKPFPETEALLENLSYWGESFLKEKIPSQFSFEDLTVKDLDKIRNSMVELENYERKCADMELSYN